MAASRVLHFLQKENGNNGRRAPCRVSKRGAFRLRQSGFRLVFYGIETLQTFDCVKQVLLAIQIHGHNCDKRRLFVRRRAL